MYLNLFICFESIYNSIWLFIVNNIAIVNGIVLFFTLIVIIWYTIETRKTRLSSEKNILFLEQENLRKIQLEKNKVQLTKSYLHSRLEVLLSATKEQTHSVSQFLDQLKQDKTVDLHFELKIDFNTKSIRIIPLTDIYDYFVLQPSELVIDNSQIDYFNSFIKQINLVDNLALAFEESFSYTNNHLRKYETKWNENIEYIRKLHDEWLTLLTSQDIDPRNDHFLKVFIKYYHDNSLLENYKDMYVSLNSLIYPTLELAKKTQPNKFATILLTPLLNCIDAANNHKNLRNIEIKEFENYNQHLSQIARDLEDLINNFF